MRTLPKQRLAQVASRRVLRDRAKQRWPMVLLTLVSIIQALALETLWVEVAGEQELFSEGLDGVIAALQAASVLLAIIVIWIFFAHLVMRFVWLPGLRDTIAPFALGLIEFVVAEFIGAGQYGLWIACISLAFLVSHVVLLSTFARAAREPENADFFAAQPTGLLQRHGPTLGSMALLLVLAGIVEFAASPLVTAIGMALVAALLLVQLWLQRVYWYDSLD
jgi:hypothetical protein